MTSFKTTKHILFGSLKDKIKSMYEEIGGHMFLLLVDKSA